MGELYRDQKNFPQALDNFNKALTIAEKQQRPDAIISASTRIGDVLRQIGKSDEAMSQYRGAIQQIESTRSRLQSAEYRQSYFEGAVDAYIGMLDALLFFKPEDLIAAAHGRVSFWMCLAARCNCPGSRAVCLRRRGV